ncbi:TIGR03435 family protein [Silvibacterium sp.]|uniref:TIGR03435 family protein n=1 Tax=Silvibacterium sp. TaxID=1964179 RepID=UPI0039E25029
MIRGRSVVAVFAFVLAYMLPPSAELLAQSSAEAKANPASSAVRHWTFDVVSIRPSSDGGFAMGVGPDGYRATGAPLAATILNAYFPIRQQVRSELVGAPDWVWKTRYDFTGKVAAADVAEWQRYRADPASMAGNPMLQSMLRAALAERCGLQIRREPGTIRGYALVLDKKGINRKEVKEASAAMPDLPIKVPMVGGGFLVPFTRGTSNPQVQYVHVTMAAFANQLYGFVGAAVVDRTGLTGAYDFSLPKLLEGAQAAEASPNDVWDFQKLGLKLEPITIPVQTVVVTHIDKPDAN